MTRSDLIAAIEASQGWLGVRIEAGKPGTQDYDVGYASYDADTDVIVVGWDSGVCTPLVVDEYTHILG